MINKDLDKLLYDLVDNGEESKNKIYNNTVQHKDKKKMKFKPLVVTCILLLILTTSGIARDVYNYVTSSDLPSGEHIESHEDKYSLRHKIPMPIPKFLNLAGKVFDEDGKKIHLITGNDWHEKLFIWNEGKDSTLYNIKGEPIVDYDKEKGEVFTAAEREAKIKKITLEEALPKLTFNPFILKDDYDFEYVIGNNIDEFDKSDYLFIKYQMGDKDISITEKKAIPETIIYGSFDQKIIEKEIEGVKLQIMETTLTFEKDGVIVTFSIEKDGKTVRATPEELINIYKGFVPYEAN
ncbi:hypothetical protein [Anaerosphaera multitolerans]|uniref:DUF4367 domain-containing protein n=1 Tax=Anaerosphaera multitolerans TaxID=2487351 RepID=A0A437S795_9FIRM|nr:hypothetical protein [Anaerosphaera multitolerans]RVU54747.1 hypothetical protein EF514_05350 [Anaerosphaera multitolerans]